MAKKPKDFDFSKKAAVYDEGVAGKASQRFYNLVVREAELQPGARVLDVGCGTGALLKKLVDKYNIIGYGTDIEVKMIEEAKNKNSEMNFQIASCDNLPFDDMEFDAVVACMAYHHFENKDGFGNETARVLKPGGVLYIVDPRFPWLVRKTMNGVLRLIRVVGEFNTPQEIEKRFAGYGFTGIGSAVDGYAQVAKLQKI